MPETSVDKSRIIAATQEAAALAFGKWREDTAPDARVWEKTKGQPVCDADMAVDALLKHYPGREVVTLNVDPLGETGGGIHCATQQMPE